MKLIRLILIGWIAGIIPGYAQVEIPELWNHAVHDEAKILTPSFIDSIEVELQRFNDSTSNQVGVFLISSLKGEPIEDLAIRVAKKWKLGQADKDNGVLLLIAKDDRQMRIEVGLGLEGALPDAICNRIIRNEIAPSFRKDAYDEGIRNGLTAIMAASKGEYSASEIDAKSPFEKWTIILIIYGLLFLFTGMGLAADSIFTWIVYVVLAILYLLVPFLGIGFGAGIWIFWIYLIGYPLARKFIPKRFLESKSHSSGSGWSKMSGWTSSGSSSSSSSSSWSSGFSGGGGSFGGGGASGSW